MKDLLGLISRNEIYLQLCNIQNIPKKYVII